MRVRLLQAFVTWCVMDCFFVRANQLDKPSMSCNDAKLYCSHYVGCNSALTTFFISCSDLWQGHKDTCTENCLRALLSLLTTEDDTGKEFIRCDCEGNSYCEERSRRIRVCSKEVMQAMTNLHDNDTILSCTLAIWICEADTSCYTALNFYRQNCDELFLGHKCTKECNNSVQVLYNRQKAKKLFTCQCEGTEAGYNCQEIKDNTMRLCFHKNSNREYLMNRNILSSAAVSQHSISIFLHILILSVLYLSNGNGS